MFNRHRRRQILLLRSAGSLARDQSLRHDVRMADVRPSVDVLKFPAESPAGPFKPASGQGM
jgi:hypothetical protein